MRHPTVRQLSATRPLTARGQPDDIAALGGHLGLTASSYADPATREAHQEALARWPLLAEIDQSLAVGPGSPTDPVLNPEGAA